MKKRIYHQLLLTGSSLFSVILLVVITIYSFLLPVVETSYLEKKKEMIKRLTETVVSSLSSRQEEVDEGIVSSEFAKSRAIRRLRDLRYGTEKLEYYWVLDKNSTVVLHPYRRDLEGQSLYDLQDITGKYFVREMMSKAFSPGAGYTEYFWQWKDQADIIEKKIAYYIYFEPWGWIVSTGFYLKDIETDLSTLKHKIALAGGGVLLVSFMIVFLLGRITYQSIKKQEELLERLRQSQKMDAIGHLAGGVAHDFNNMLTGILSAAELAEEFIDNEQPDGRKYLDIIKKSAERASGLTQKLLVFSRKGQYDMKIADIHEIIIASIELLEHTLNKNIEIKTDFKAEDHLVSADYNQLQNLFINLSLNAAYSMPEGGTLLFSSSIIFLDESFCRASQFRLKPGKYINISVEDTGSGIAPEIIGKIFDPFFTTRKQGEGTGLGLSTVYGAVLQHNGAVNVYSEPGTGTVFRLYFPLSHDSGLPGSVDNEAVSDISGTVLVVDDEEVIRKTASAMLERCGLNVITAENGLEAIEKFAADKENIDIIILDMIMPEMSGKKCFYRLREIDAYVKVIISSGFSKEEDIRQLREDGLSGFIGKPFRKDELLGIISDTISKK